MGEIVSLLNRSSCRRRYSLNCIGICSSSLENGNKSSVLLRTYLWAEYGNFYRELIHAIKAGTKDYIIFAHEDQFLNEQSMQMESRVPVKGSVGKTGVEADFTTILSTKQMPVKKLQDPKLQNDLLHISEEEEEDGFKYVFCTRVTKETVGEKMRSAMGLWKRNELYIDNDVNQVMQRLREYYNKS